MGPYFATTFDHSLLICVNLHQSTSEFDWLLIRKIQNVKIHLQNFQGLHFLRKKNCGAYTTSHRACNLRNLRNWGINIFIVITSKVISVVYVCSPIYIILRSLDASLAKEAPMTENVIRVLMTWSRTPTFRLPSHWFGSKVVDPESWSRDCEFWI